MTTDVRATETMARVLERLPGVVYAARATADGAAEWIYVNDRTAEMYDVPLDELRKDPTSLLRRLEPEDQPVVAELFEQARVTLRPMKWLGRVKLGDGTERWLESHTTVEREADGAVVWFSQVLDVSERQQTRIALDESERVRRRREQLYRSVIDNLPLGVMVIDGRGQYEVWNPAQEAMTAREKLEALSTTDTGRFGLFRPDGTTRLRFEEYPIARVLAGAPFVRDELVVRGLDRADDLRIEMTAVPLHDEQGNIWAGMAVSQNVTAQRRLEEEIGTRNAQLAASEEAKTGLIERLRYAIDELSNPILEVWDEVLAMPIIGIVDSRRTADMVQRLLAEVARGQARHVIIDLTGVEIVDTKTADHLIKLVRKVELVGATCMLTGIRPAVAQTLVDIGVDFGRLTTLRSLKHGLREALRVDRAEREARGSLDDRDPVAPTRSRSS